MLHSYLIGNMLLKLGAENVVMRRSHQLVLDAVINSLRFFFLSLSKNTILGCYLIETEVIFRVASWLASKIRLM